MTHAKSTRTDDRLGDLTIHYQLAQVTEQPAESLLVLMPAALRGDRADRNVQVFSRFNWHELWPDSDVMAFADPAIQVSTELNGAWFINPNHDVIESIAEVVADYAFERGILQDRITFYGSSLGGFGAIGCAALFQGARAVAEVPQIDFASWGEFAINQVQEFITGCDIEEYRSKFPEQISVQARLKKYEHIPPIRLITNRNDVLFDEQLSFFDWCQESGLPSSGPFEFIMTTEVDGHKPISKETARSLILP